MSDTSVQAAPSASPPAAGPAPTPEAPAVTRQRPSLAYRALVAVASLRLTVALFVLSLLLVFFGTLAQIDSGIWTTVKAYFRDYLVWIPFQLAVRFGQVFFGVPRTLEVGGSFPFPAGWTLGGLLLANLLAAHIIRFKLSWKRAGIYVLHAGLIVLLLGELITGLTQVEASMAIANGETVNFTDVRQNVELAITTPNPNKPGEDLVVTVPQHRLVKPGRISDPQLPFDVEVKEFWKNSALPFDPGRTRPNSRVALNGGTYGLVPQSEASGVETNAKEDMPAVTVAFLAKGTDQALAEHVTSVWYYPNSIHRRLEFAPQTVTAGGVTYTVELRPRREYKEFAVKLLEFKREDYPGTRKPKSFSSLIEVAGKNGERREVLISMNKPMWADQETYYQQGWIPDPNHPDPDVAPAVGTILQVVRNPGWFMPYVSCVLVVLGMLIHFGWTLVNFLQRRVVS
jgi:hypothetical protein